MRRRFSGPGIPRGAVMPGGSDVQSGIPTLHLRPERDYLENGLPTAHLRPDQAKPSSPQHSQNRPDQGGPKLPPPVKK